MLAVVCLYMQRSLHHDKKFNLNCSAWKLRRQICELTPVSANKAIVKGVSVDMATVVNLMVSLCYQ